jgi:hypothetical protein
VTVALPSTIDYLFNNSAKIFAQDSQSTFLGTIASRYDSNSVLSRFGDYGSKFSSTSMWNRFGDYGGTFSSYSPFNRFPSSPPEIYIGTTFWGYLSVSKFLLPNTLDPNELLNYAFQKYNDDYYLTLKIE